MSIDRPDERVGTSTLVHKMRVAKKGLPTVFRAGRDGIDPPQDGQ